MIVLEYSNGGDAWSVWRCAFCKPLKERSYKEDEAQAKREGRNVEDMGTRGQNLNPPTCPYNYVKIGKQIYKRDSGNVHDDYTDDIYYDYTDTHCHDCGVLYGKIHHVDCDMERCPKCRDQFISCECGIGAKYYEGPDSTKGKKFTSPVHFRDIHH